MLNGDNGDNDDNNDDDCVKGQENSHNNGG